MKPFGRLAAGSAVFVTALVAAFFATGLVKDVQFASAQKQVEATREQLAQVEDLATVFRQVGKAVEPSVVNINVTKSARTNARLPFDDEMLRRFFPDRDGDGEPDMPDELEEGFNRPQQGTGSGVIMEVENGSAFIVTNNHVAGGATEMVITLADGRTIDNAKVIGTDPKTDLAVLKIDVDRVIAAKWGNSDQLQKGDWIMAFGSPFGYIGSMTHGIVSALNRHNIGILGTMGYENFIQVDAPINPGNSGGPLVNVRGEVVGINTAIASVTGGFAGVGFAIPSNQAKVVYTQLKDKGKITRGYLGIAIDETKNPRNPNAKMVLETLDYKGPDGILVWEVPTGPSSGVLEPGDVITQLNGKPITDVQALRNVIAAMAPDTEAKLQIVRNGKTQDVTVKIGEQPDEPLLAGGRRGSRPRGDSTEEQSSAQTLGIRLSDLSDQLAQRHGLSDVEQGGAVITQVAPNSPAQQAGIRVGDLITRVDKQSVTSAKEASDALAKADLSKGVVLQVTSRDGSRIVTLRARPQR
ncbi:MAG TPA: trypsin-like peptidase domain-containing protein [Tepidisphaeraceae bacterium]|nr:trypsin-like peptidase domain-containing protein [Tepidisphaeraceae bacterium]